MATLQDFRQDLPLLVESGLIAIKQGDEESARKLFNAVGIIAPENSVRQMGYGLIALHKMDSKGAQKYFNEILKKEPDNYRALAFLGFSHAITCMQDGISEDEKIKGLQRGEEIAREVLKKSDAEYTRQLAQSLLDWLKELEKLGQQTGPAG